MTRTERSGAPPPEQRNGGATYPAAPEAISHHQTTDPEQGNPPRPEREVIQSATGLAPCGRRSMWLWLVLRCAFCGGSHAHRGGRAGGLRRSGCGRGVYRITASRGRRAA